MLRNYLKIAFRNLVKNKVYSVINILGLSLGMLGGIIIFQLVRFHLSTDSYHKNTKNIYRVVMNLHLDDGKVEYEKGSPFILNNSLKNDFSSIENTAYLGQQELTISVPKQNDVNKKFLEKEEAAFVDENYFKVFSYQWVVGDASFLNMPNSVALTEKYSRKYFGSENPINKTLRLNNLQEVKVVGIIKDLPENTDLKTEVFVSLPTIKTVIPNNSYDNWLWFIKSRETYVLLKDNISKESLEAQLPLFSKKYFGEMSKYYHFHLQPLSDVHFNIDYGGKIKKSTIYFFSMIGILLVLIACINFINLSTAQSFKRFKEIGIRKTLGSSQMQVFLQFIYEVSIITICSVVIAVMSAWMINPYISNWLKIQTSFSYFFDINVLIFISLLTFFAIIVAGFYPSVVISRFNPLRALKGMKNANNESFILRKGLVIAQFSTSFVLIAVSVLIFLQINFLHNKDIGSTKDSILHVKIPNSGNVDLGTLKNQILQKIFVKNVSFSGNAPSSQSGWGGSIKYDNRDWEKFVARSRIADEDYLDTYQIKLISGRKPIASDTLREVLVNKKLVKELGLKNSNDVLGKQITIGDAQDGKGIIVGVVNDFNNSDLYSAIEPTVIYSLKSRYKQASIGLSSFDTNDAIRELTAIWVKTFPNDVFEYSFYNEELSKFYEREKLLRSLVISFGVLSILISCLGLFGLASFTITQRTKEVGIRKVLGASVWSITSLLSKDFIKLIITSILLASPISYYFMQKWLQNFVYRIDISWWIFIVSGILVFLITLLTVSYQSIKAALMNPVKSLKTE